MSALKSPVIWFGGKRSVADVIWSRLGDVPNYIEPFVGSAAVLLARPHEPRVETMNDADGLLCNLWRSLKANPEEVAYWADSPVMENDLHARHVWLIQQARALQLPARLEGDPHFFDAKIAGWWVWGLSCWIGGRWCLPSGPWWPDEQGRLVKAERGSGAGIRSAPGDAGSRGVHQAGVFRRLPHLLGSKGVHQQEAHHVPPLLPGRGVERRIPHLSARQGVNTAKVAEGILTWFTALQARLRHVRVCCGDWSRITGPSVTTLIGLTGVVLDPPYGSDTGRDMACYAQEDGNIAGDVRTWCLANGPNPLYRIALCGYDTEHSVLEQEGWSVHAWAAKGGYGRGEDSNGLANRHRERIWFSPHCLSPAKTQQTLF